MKAVVGLAVKVEAPDLWFAEPVEGYWSAAVALCARLCLPAEEIKSLFNQSMCYLKCSLPMERVSEHLWIITSIH